MSDESYAISAIVLLPINSVFDPLLYSNIPELIWNKVFASTKCGMWVGKKCCSKNQTKKDTSSSSRTAAISLKSKTLNYL